MRIKCLAQGHYTPAIPANSNQGPHDWEFVVLSTEPAQKQLAFSWPGRIHNNLINTDGNLEAPLMRIDSKKQETQTPQNVLIKPILNEDEKMKCHQRTSVTAAAMISAHGAEGWILAAIYLNHIHCHHHHQQQQQHHHYYYYYIFFRGWLWFPSPHRLGKANASFIPSEVSGSVLE